MNSFSQLELPGKSIRPYVIAHRGNRVLCPENTLAAFKRAISDGADIIETDIHLTSDNEFVCIHDDTVDRTTNGKGAVAKLSFTELRNLSANYGKIGFESEKVPSLVELIEMLPQQVGLALELKSIAFIQKDICLKLALLLKKYSICDRTIILSFSPKKLRVFSEVAPELPLGFITIRRFWPHYDFPLQGPFWPILAINPWYVWAAKRKGQMICPLDPSPNRRLSWYLKVGCDAILTDHPHTTIPILRSLNTDAAIKLRLSQVLK